jgi:hypothetical protein
LFGSKHRQRFRGLERDPGTTASERELQHRAHELAAAEYGIVHVRVSLPVRIVHEAQELRIPKTAPRIPLQPETVDRTMAEVEQDAEHIVVKEVWGGFFNAKAAA